MTRSGGEEVRAFVPNPLPPEPPLRLEEELGDLLGQAVAELDRLNIAARMVPDPDWFIFGFVRKEAVLTSQIEGKQATLADLLAYEAGLRDERVAGDVQEVCNYLDALVFARQQIHSPRGLPLSLRLLRQAHRRLMKGVRGEDKRPGEFRTSQNWVGGTRPGNATFVPPPPDRVPVCLDALEKYLHEGSDLPHLVRAGLIHVQFETIHPFLDGNGRLGRLLIALLLEQSKLLDWPLLYISLHFRRHQREYYERLNAVRLEGDWEGWARFFLEGVASVAREATEAAGRLFSVFQRDRKGLLDDSRTSLAAVRLMEKLPARPVLTIADAAKLLATTTPTAAKAISLLADRGILKETTGRRRDRTFAYASYLDVLKEGTELRR